MRKRTVANLDMIRASFGDPETGVLGAFVPNGKLFIPGGPVTLTSEATLRWEIHWDGITFKTPTRAMLDSFIQLWGEPGSNEKIRQFAERWGPLQVHGDGTQLDVGKLEWINERVSVGTDHLLAWKYFSRRAYSILEIAAELEKGSRGKEPEWEILSSPQDPGPAPKGICAVSPFGLPNWARREFIAHNGPAYGKPVPLERLKGIIAGEVSEWLERFGVNLQMEWAPRSNWQLQVFFRGWLLSAVALQLALAVIHADAFYICSECDRLYARSGKRPNAGEKNYCPKCGRTKAVQHAGRRLRQRRVEARRLHRTEGKSAAQIAKLLGVRKVETVRGWIAKGK